jgi:hypothetical protein
LIKIAGLELSRHWRGRPAVPWWNPHRCMEANVWQPIANSKPRGCTVPIRVGSTR